MKLFDVYPLYKVTPTIAKDVWVYDKEGTQYLDLYGGHAVISIGHSHPEFLRNLNDQLNKIAFYSNAVQNPLQQELAREMGNISGLSEYKFFLCSTGAEAVENALKLASFYTKKKKVISFTKAFHGRTSAAVSVSDYAKIRSPLNNQHEVAFVKLEDYEGLERAFGKKDIAAVIIEPIQGVGGLDQPSNEFMEFIDNLCKKNRSCLIVDEVQSGCGRTGNYFAYQPKWISPTMITVAKGIGNGFPIGGLLISPEIHPSYGLLGTTFGGSHLACVAALTVINVLKKEKLLSRIASLEVHFKNRAQEFSAIKNVKGRGLMLGLEFDFTVSDLRKKLLYEHQIFAGGSADKNLIRVLPPLTIKKQQIDMLFDALKNIL